MAEGRLRKFMIIILSASTEGSTNSSSTTNHHPDHRDQRMAVTNFETDLA